LHRPTNNFSKTHAFSLQAVVISSQSVDFRLKLGYGALQILIFSLKLRGPSLQAGLDLKGNAIDLT
jgi:hypothetical protein